MTLVTALIFMAVMSLVVAGVSAGVSQNGELSQRFKNRDARSAVLTAALRNARTGTFYYSTLLSLTPSPPTTDPFYRCAIDDGANDCDSGVSHPFVLFDHTDVSAPAIQVLGSEAAPVHYDLYGQVCSTPSRNLCYFDVFAEFVPACANATVTCKQAAVFLVTVFVRVNPFYEDGSFLKVASARQTVPIADFVNYYTPILPPIVPPHPSGGQHGAPIGYGAGPTGGITATWLIEQGAPPPTPSSGPPPSAPSPPMANTCASGNVVSSSGCVDFNF